MKDLPVLILIAVYTETNRKVVILTLFKKVWNIIQKKMLVALETTLFCEHFDIFFIIFGGKLKLPYSSFF